VGVADARGDLLAAERPIGERLDDVRAQSFDGLEVQSAAGEPAERVALALGREPCDVQREVAGRDEVQRPAHGPGLDQGPVDVDRGAHARVGQPADARGEREPRGRADLRLRAAHRAAGRDQRPRGRAAIEPLGLQPLCERILLGPRPRRAHQVSPPVGGGHAPCMRLSSAIWPTW
jgi:hypothetical protein